MKDFKILLEGSILADVEDTMKHGDQNVDTMLRKKLFDEWFNPYMKIKRKSPVGIGFHDMGNPVDGDIRQKVFDECVSVDNDVIVIDLGKSKSGLRLTVNICVGEGLPLIKVINSIDSKFHSALQITADPKNKQTIDLSKYIHKGTSVNSVVYNLPDSVELKDASFPGDIKEKVIYNNCHFKNLKGNWPKCAKIFDRQTQINIIFQTTGIPSNTSYESDFHGGKLTIR